MLLESMKWSNIFSSHLKRFYIGKKRKRKLEETKREKISYREKKKNYLLQKDMRGRKLEK